MERGGGVEFSTDRRACRNGAARAKGIRSAQRCAGLRQGSGSRFQGLPHPWRRSCRSRRGSWRPAGETGRRGARRGSRFPGDEAEQEVASTFVGTRGRLRGGGALGNKRSREPGIGLGGHATHGSAPTRRSTPAHSVERADRAASPMAQAVVTAPGFQRGGAGNESSHRRAGGRRAPRSRSCGQFAAPGRRVECRGTRAGGREAPDCLIPRKRHRAEDGAVRSE